MKYLIKKREINETETKEIYDFVVGHIIELTVADDFVVKKKSLEGIK
jgi:hypothetical protein